MTHPERQRNTRLREIGRGKRISVNDAYTQQRLETFLSAMLHKGERPDEVERLIEQLRQRYERKP